MRDRWSKFKAFLSAWWDGFKKRNIADTFPYDEKFW